MCRTQCGQRLARRTLRLVPSPDLERSLDENALAALLASGSGWERAGHTLTKTFKRSGFSDAVAFVNAIAKEANAADHHPDIHIEAYRRVRVVLTTHLTGGISDADIQLARRIDELAGA